MWSLPHDNSELLLRWKLIFLSLKSRRWFPEWSRSGEIPPWCWFGIPKPLQSLHQLVKLTIERPRWTHPKHENFFWLFGVSVFAISQSHRCVLELCVVLVIPLRALHTLWRSLFSLLGPSFHHVHQFSSAKSRASPWIISSEHNVTDSLIPSTKLKRTQRSQSRPHNWVCHIAMHVIILSHVLINTWEKRQGACNVKCRVELSSNALVDCGQSPPYVRCYAKT
jgi:hypothetical protein